MIKFAVLKRKMQQLLWRYILLATCLAAPIAGFTQKTIAKGYVKDIADKSGLLGAAVVFKGTLIGTSADNDGYFFLETSEKVDSVFFIYAGMKSQTVSINQGKENVLEIYLEEDVSVLTTVTINRTKNPALILLDSVRAHRAENDIKRMDSYQVASYVKTRFNLYNLTEKFINQPILKRFKYIFENADTVDGVPHYPVLISEIISEVYKKKGGQTREVISANRISGIKNSDDLSKFLGSVYNEFNFYDDNQVILGKTFMGPVSPLVANYYFLDLVDSAYIGNQWCYKIKFRAGKDTPKEAVYQGEAWIHDSTFAIKSISLKMNPQANINLIAGFGVQQEFELQNGQWAKTMEDAVLNFDPKDFVDFSMNIAPKNEKFRVSINKSSILTNYRFNGPPSADFPTISDDIVTKEGASNFGEEFWAEARPTPLTKQDSTTYNNWNKLWKDKLFRFMYKVGDLIGSGYVNLNYFGIGPIYEMYSFNQIEGHRIKIGGRTGDSLSRRFIGEGHLIYGTKDKRFKWDVKLNFHINKRKDPWRMIGIRARQDIEQLGLNLGQWRPDNILATFLRRRTLSDLSYLNEVTVFYDHDWFQGLNQKLSVTWMQYFDTGTLRFGINDPVSGAVNYIPDFTRFEIRLETTIAYGIKYLKGKNKRRPIRGKFPTVKVIYALGVKGVLGSDYYYHNLKVSISDRIRIKPLGYGDYEIAAGKIFGTVPYALMEIHPGNDTYTYDPFGFNLMNYFEFISDQFVSARYEHHFDGFFFNKIPLLRKLKWREVIAVRAVIGNITERNMKHMQLPSQSYELRDQRTGKYMPYVEMNFGIENIFNILRIDFLWRLTHRRGPDPVNPGKELYPQSINWGIMGGISLKI